MMKKDTLASIALKTGCSVTTVSRVLNGQAEKYRISKQTAERVMQEVNEANFTPNIIAKGLRTSRTNTLGLLIPNIENSFFANVAGVIIREARNFNYKVIVSDTQENDRYEQDGISALMARNVDGIIAVPCGHDPKIFIDIKEKGVPIVMVDRYFDSVVDIPYVSTDNYRGAVLAMEYLISNGHKNIVCIQGTPYSTPVKDRVRGCLDVMQAHNLGDSISVSGEAFSIQNGYIETKLALARHRKPSAIFALSNQILLGAVKAIQEVGLKIPEDISIISFDDNNLFNYLNPSITCIAQPVEDISLLTVKILVNQIAGAVLETPHIHLPPIIIPRKSVKTIGEV